MGSEGAGLTLNLQGAACKTVVLRRERGLLTLCAGTGIRRSAKLKKRCPVPDVGEMYVP